MKEEPANKNNGEDGEDYVPPESSPVIVEEDALYTVKYVMSLIIVIVKLMTKMSILIFVKILILSYWLQV